MKNVDGDSILAYNIFWNNGVDDLGSNIELGTTLYSDPLVGANYMPQPGSPVIDLKYSGCDAAIWNALRPPFEAPAT